MARFDFAPLRSIARDMAIGLAVVATFTIGALAETGSPQRGTTTGDAVPAVVTAAGPLEVAEAAPRASAPRVVGPDRVGTASPAGGLEPSRITVIVGLALMFSAGLTFVLAAVRSMSRRETVATARRRTGR